LKKVFFLVVVSLFSKPPSNLQPLRLVPVPQLLLFLPMLSQFLPSIPTKNSHSSRIDASARAILKNAGEGSSVIVCSLLKQYGSPDKFAWGYYAAKGESTDMTKAGIVDPLKVVRTALVDASGVASFLTTSEACIVDAPEEDKPAPGAGGMGDMY